MIFKGAAQLDRALHQGIVSHKNIGPDRLDEHLLSDQASGILDEVLECLLDLGTKLDLLLSLEHTSTSNVNSPN